MPCNTDYMEPSATEIRLSKIASLLDEVKRGIKCDKNHWRGYHPAVYNQTYDKYSGATPMWEYNNTMELIEELDKIDESGINNVINYSLEVQIWWRDFKNDRANRERILEQLRIKSLSKEQQQAEILKHHVEAVRYAGLKKQEAINKAKKYLTEEELKIIMEK